MIKKTENSRILLIIFFVFICIQIFSAAAEDAPESFYSLNARLLNGNMQEFSEYEGKVIVVTNIAFECGTTPQLKALQDLANEFGEKGLVVLGFPSNEFTGENLDNKEAIRSFCTDKYSISFPIFYPDKVSGSEPQPVFRFLSQNTADQDRGAVEFNFEKFLIDRKGKIRGRYGSFTSVQSQVFKNAVNNLLSQE